jgi:hypothetical protein
MNRITILLSTIFLFTINILADIPPPPVGEQIRIELKQNYPDYQFYIASYDLKVVPNPNPPHISRPNMVINIPDSFKLRQIDLSVEKPLIEAITNARIENRGTLVGKDLWLIAVKRTLGADVESKVKTAIDNRKNEDGIYTANLSQELESKKDERVGAKIILNTVTKLDEKGLVIQVSEGTMAQTNAKTANCIGLGFILMGIAFVGIWWTRKRIV